MQNVNTGWQSLTADYLSHLPASTLPLSLHHFLKYSAESIKKEAQNPLTVRKFFVQTLRGVNIFNIMYHPSSFQTIDMSHAQTTQSLNLNSLSAGLISNANILNQPQPPQHHLQNQQQQHQQSVSKI